MESSEQKDPSAGAGAHAAGQQHDQSDVEITNALKAISKELQAGNEESGRRDDRRWNLERAALLVAFGYAVVTFCLWRSTADSVRISARSLMEAHQGKMAFGGIKVDPQVLTEGPFSIVASFANVGTGVAKGIDSSGSELQFVALDPAVPCEQSGPPKLHPGHGAAGDVGPGGYHFHSFDGRLNTAQGSLLAERKCTLRITGSVRYIAYTDVDGVNYPDATPFCQEFVWNPFVNRGRWLGCADFLRER
jgi:hypothetical protein